jgi:hypothetical protein
MAQDLKIAKKADNSVQHQSPNVLGSAGILPDGSGYINKPADGGIVPIAPHQTTLSVKLR